MFLSLLCAAFSVAHGGEILPARSYTTSDGLAGGFLQNIVRDSKGFLWFCARGGLSRFDGHTFKNYTTADGLPHSTVNMLLETRAGEYWVSTNGGGAARFNQTRQDVKFTVFKVGETSADNRVGVMYEDRSGKIWAATDGGLFWFDRAANTFRRFESEAAPPDYLTGDIAEDSSGALWVTGRLGAHRILPDGETQVFNAAQLNLEEGADYLNLTADRNGRLWLGSLGKMHLLRLDVKPGDSPIEREVQIIEPTYDDFLINCFALDDGNFLITTDRRVIEFDGQKSWEFAPGSFEGKHLGNAVEDIEGNLWICTHPNGVLRVNRNGFVRFADPPASMKGGDLVMGLGETSAGNVVAFQGTGAILKFDGANFIVGRPVRASKSIFAWMTSAVFLDSAGETWILSYNEGLLRFPAVSDLSLLEHTPPKAIYNRQTGFPSNAAFRIYEDRNRDLWLSTNGNERNRLWRWQRSTETFQQFTEVDGVPNSNSPFSFAEDAAGNLWIGFYEGGVGRFHHGKFEFFAETKGFSDRMVTDIYLDREQRIWICSNAGGLRRVDAPDAEEPVVSTVYKQANGLSSDDVRTVVEDNYGRIYAGTIRGIDRLDIASGNVEHFGLDDGLPSDFLISSLRDSKGNLWFGTFNGLVRLTPEREIKHAVPPDVFITGLSAAGMALPISDIGEREVKNLEFASTENNLQIDFGAISFAFGENLRFRYKLEGAGAEWSAPTEHRSVNLSLAPGLYRFVIQAVTSSGEPLSDKIAVVSFKILSPIWQRWWFMAAAAMFMFGISYALYRYRVRQLLAMERVRTRIASDLHDDIGASLSQIAVISEVLQRQIAAADEPVGKNLSLVARVSREAVDSMSDIVWAINPNRDNLQDLIRRMRRFASETLPNRNIELKFDAPEQLPTLKLGADFRREVFLIFKESVNNILKHSDSTAADIAVRIEAHELCLRVSDNGRGFDENGNGEAGHGLQSMRRRAMSLGGTFEIASTGGAGTIVLLRVPLRKQTHLN